MRVLQIIPELETGGAERTTVDVAAALIAAGHSAHVATARGRLIGALNAMGATVHILPVDRKNPLMMLHTAMQLAQLIRRAGIDIVHARSRACAWPALWAARWTGTPFVTTYHGIYNAKSGLKRWYNGVMARGDIVIANSQYTADHLIAAHGTDPARVRVIPRGVDLATFDPATVTPERMAALRTAWGMPDQPGFVILCPGRLTRWKGQTTLIDAAADLPWPFTLVLVGSAQGRTGFEAELNAQIKRLGLTDRVRIAGHCDDMAAAYALADVVVCPSLEPEAFGRTAAEAGAMGKPVIASAHGGALEVIADMRTGYLIPPGDEKVTTKTLDVIHTMPLNSRAEMGQRARMRVEDQFSLTQMTDKTLSVYDELNPR